MKFKPIIKAVEFAANAIVIGSAAKAIYERFRTPDEDANETDEDNDDLDQDNEDTDEEDQT